MPTWVFLALWIGILQEYAVVLNIYNADLVSFIEPELEYSLVPIGILITLLVHRNVVSVVSTVYAGMCCVAHLQWLLHSPFRAWPSWWPATKSANDIRHRTEYYDTHVMCLGLWCVVFVAEYGATVHRQATPLLAKVII